MNISNIGFENSFEEDVADNFCTLQRNIEIQILNINTITRHNGRSKKQIGDLNILLKKYKGLRKKCKNIIELDFLEVFNLMDDFDDLTEDFALKINQMENMPTLTGLDPFLDMDDEGPEFSGEFNYLMN